MDGARKITQWVKAHISLSEDQVKFSAPTVDISPVSPAPGVFITHVFHGHLSPYAHTHTHS